MWPPPCCMPLWRDLPLLLFPQNQIADLQSIKVAIMDDVRKVDTELRLVNGRLEEQSAKSGLLTLLIEGHQATLAVGPGWTPGQKATLSSLNSNKSDLQTALDSKRQTATILRRDVDSLLQVVERGEKAKAETLDLIATVKEESSASVTKAQKLMASQARQTAELKQLQVDMEAAQAKVAEKEAGIKLTEDSLTRTELAVRMKKQEIEKVLQEQNGLHSRTAAYTDELDAQMSTNEGVAKDLQTIRSRTEEFWREDCLMRVEVDRTRALHELASRKLGEAADELLEVLPGVYSCCCCCVFTPPSCHTKRASLTLSSLACFQVETDTADLSEKAKGLRASAVTEAKANEVIQRQHADLLKERDILRVSLEKLSGSTLQVETVIAVQSNSQRMTENDLLAHRRNVKELREAIDDAQDELAMLEEKSEEANRRAITVQEQVRGGARRGRGVRSCHVNFCTTSDVESPLPHPNQVTLQEIQELTVQKKTVELGKKLKQQQSVYEAARDERNAYSKNLLEIEEDIQRITFQFKSMTKLVRPMRSRVLFADGLHI